MNLKHNVHMKTIKQLLLLLVVGHCLLSASCRNEDVTPPDIFNTTGSDTLSGAITENRTLTANKTYYIKGITFVKNNATLSIEPGTIIKAIKGSKATLVVTRGAKINAEGTATKPIVFTSNQSASLRTTGDWGGIVICGKARVNSNIGGVPNQKLLEGFDAAEASQFGADIIAGGTDDGDNSGVLKYVRIEYSGIALSSAPNSELNGLSLIAVGSGTTIDYVQVSYSGDDSFEWWGGTVNAKHLIALASVDDDFDTDNGYSGKVQFALGIRDPNFSDVSLASGASHAFESDNEDPIPTSGIGSTPLTTATFSNVTILGPLNFGALPSNHKFSRAILNRRLTNQGIFNAVFSGYPVGLNIHDSVTVLQAGNNNIPIYNSIFSGFPLGKVLNNSVFNNTNNFTSSAYYMNTSYANDTTTTVSQWSLGSIGTANTVNPVPASGSVLLSGASFTNSRLAIGFTSVAYRGAFAANDNWHLQWTEFNPQSRNY
jgi:hypothetical protein